MERCDSRSVYWDNAKALLIFLVVLAHYYCAGYIYSGKSGGVWVIPQAVFSFIYLFHMPLFAFISGYFSKKVDARRSEAFSQLLLPYLLCNTFCILLDHWLFGSALKNPLFYPYGHLWYLIALFLWRYFAKDLSKLRLSWLWALGFSLICSVLTPGKDWWLLANCITFLPFFLLGLETGPEQIQTIRKLPKALCAAVLVLTFAGTLLGMHRFGFTADQLGFFSSLFSLDLSGLPHLAITILRYLLALVLGICVLNLIPERQTRLSAIGRNTMIVYLLHNLPGIRNLLYLLDPFPDQLVLSMIWWTLWSVAVTLILGTNRAANLYRRGMNCIRNLFPLKKVQL